MEKLTLVRISVVGPQIKRGVSLPYFLCLSATPVESYIQQMNTLNNNQCGAMYGEDESQQAAI